uniref:Uncharacterized protein n=1 Tax=Oryza punctata TaxID=4537 RepID=A0A0E0KBQ9_ORYPU
MAEDVAAATMAMTSLSDDLKLTTTHTCIRRAHRHRQIEREKEKGFFAFLELNDGSCVSKLQVLVEATSRQSSRPISGSGDTPFPIPLAPSLAPAARQFTIILTGADDTPFPRYPHRRRRRGHHQRRRRSRVLMQKNTHWPERSA